MTVPSLNTVFAAGEGDAEEEADDPAAYGAAQEESQEARQLEDLALRRRAAGTYHPARALQSYSSGLPNSQNLGQPNLETNLRVHPVSSSCCIDT